MEHKKLLSQSMKFAHILFLHEIPEFCAFSVQIAFLKLLIMLSKSSKFKQMVLPVTQKLKFMRKQEKEASVTSVCEEYDVAKQTVSDIRKLKDKLIEYSAKAACGCIGRQKW